MGACHWVARPGLALCIVLIACSAVGSARGRLLRGDLAPATAAAAPRSTRSRALLNQASKDGSSGPASMRGGLSAAAALGGAADAWSLRRDPNSGLPQARQVQVSSGRFSSSQPVYNYQSGSARNMNQPIVDTETWLRSRGQQPAPMSYGGRSPYGFG
ncbi:MAG: hypothetical protein J3K34DRAFT_441365 [Monoraphidium minutum]|nr:MAG: hypothetical protein J3K34DRAFT_441365 [Monoraphidium minutum]